MPSPKAIRLRALIEHGMASLPDPEASEAVTLSPLLHGDGRLIPSGTRIQWEGRLYRAAVDLWDRPDSTPETAPNLWERIQYVNGARIIPDPITAGLAFAKGERGWWDGKVYKSLRDGNVHCPPDAPDMWEVQA